jgi:hypothetical protein
MLAPVCGDWVSSALAHLQITVPETTKTTADPIRFLNLIVFLVAARAVVNRLQLHHKAAFRPVILCGQHALPVFAAGLFLSDLFTLSGSAGHGGPIYWTVINLTGVSALLLVAKLASRIKRQPVIFTVAVGSAARAPRHQGGKMVAVRAPGSPGVLPGMKELYKGGAHCLHIAVVNHGRSRPVPPDVATPQLPAAPGTGIAREPGV